MEFLDFCKAIQEAVENDNKNNGVSEKNLILLAELDKIIKSDEVNKSLSMTQATILFEGFYHHLSTESLKKICRLSEPSDGSIILVLLQLHFSYRLNCRLIKQQSYLMN